jgi:c-di-GMP-binding flagellar brake protein YcgR
MDTRLATRTNIDLKIICKIEPKYQQKFGLACGDSFEAKALDISVLGVGLLCKYFLPKGLVLEVDIDFAPFGQNEIIKIRGEIRHAQYLKNLGYRIGIKFLDISYINKKSIDKYVFSRERRKEPRIRLADN